MSKFKKIIFIDEENTMLSPLAEALMRKMLALMGENHIQIASRGAVVLFPEPVNPKITAIAAEMGISLQQHKAREIKESDFSETTLILALDEKNKNRIYRQFTSARNVFSIKSYLEKSGDVLPPVGGSVEEYKNICEELKALLEGLVEKEINS